MSTEEKEKGKIVPTEVLVKNKYVAYGDSNGTRDYLHSPVKGRPSQVAKILTYLKMFC